MTPEQKGGLIGLVIGCSLAALLIIGYASIPNQNYKQTPKNIKLCPASATEIMKWPDGRVDCCYYETGELVNEYYQDGYYYVEIENNDGKHTVYFPEDNTIPGDGSNISLRWCYIEDIEKYRIRGAWRV